MKCIQMMDDSYQRFCSAQAQLISEFIGISPTNRAFVFPEIFRLNPGPEVFYT